MTAFSQIQLRFIVDGEPSPVRIDIEARPKEIAEELSPDQFLWESIQPLIDWDSLLKSEDQNANFRLQAASVLQQDLELFWDWLSNPISAGDVFGAGGGVFPAFEKKGIVIVARGDEGVPGPECNRQPFWVISRLIDSGLLFELGWEIEAFSPIQKLQDVT